MKVVIDTNVLVSALLNAHGAEAAVIFAVSDGRLTWCVSPAILAEYAAVLHRPKFSRIPEVLKAALLGLAGQAQVAHPTLTLKSSPHDEDNRFYECAHAAHAACLVTGNRKHFPKDLPPTKIVDARQLLTTLEAGTKTK